MVMYILYTSQQQNTLDGDVYIIHITTTEHLDGDVYIIHINRTTCIYYTITTTEHLRW